MNKKILTTAIITGLTALVGLGAFLGTKTAVKETRAIVENLDSSYNLYYQDMVSHFADFVEFARENNCLYTGLNNTPTGAQMTAYANYLDIGTNYVSTIYGGVYYNTRFAVSQSSDTYKQTRIYFYQYPSSQRWVLVSAWYDSTTQVYYNFDYGYQTYNGSSNGKTSDSNQVHNYKITSGAGALYNFVKSLYEADNPSEGGGEGGDTPTPITPPADSYTFTFAYQINYYAPYSQNIDSLFVEDSNMTTSSTYQVKKILEDISFTSGGEEFNTIQLRYISAEGQKYKDDSQSIQTFENTGFASFVGVEYFNTETNRLVIVNDRITQTYSSGGSVSVLQTKGSLWKSSDYQVITFAEAIEDTLKTQLSTLNNANLYGNTYQTGNDIGLGSAFTLLGSAFTSWTGILSVQVLPNISLGLLIFLPMIVGIIILIIWIVKR